MKHTIRTAILLAAACVALAGCKKSSLSCTYVITPLLEEENSGVEFLDHNTIGYAFYQDTAKYEISSYDDALNGIARGRKDGSAVNYDLKGQFDRSLRLNIGPITRVPVLMTVVDTVRRMYAWRQVPMENDIEAVYVPLRFRPWKTTRTYTDSRWTFVNESIPETE